ALRRPHGFLFEEDVVAAAAASWSAISCSWLTAVRSRRGTSRSGSRAAAMAFKDTGKTPVEPEVAIHRIRITLTSRNVKSLEKDSENHNKKNSLR
uniref:Ribosomal protein S20 n=2 Tax=Equus TaxID=9789 RepID=A0A5F5PIB6_HORSE